MNKPAKLYRQGDVFVERVQRIPDNAILDKSPVIILAHGEATGHAHTVEDRDSTNWWKSDTEQFIEVFSPSRIIHQEHAPITLPEGRYRIVRQREYTPQAIRNVAD